MIGSGVGGIVGAGSAAMGDGGCVGGAISTDASALRAAVAVGVGGELWIGVASRPQPKQSRTASAAALRRVVNADRSRFDELGDLVLGIAGVGKDFTRVPTGFGGRGRVLARG